MLWNVSFSPEVQHGLTRPSDCNCRCSCNVGVPRITRRELWFVPRTRGNGEHVAPPPSVNVTQQLEQTSVMKAGTCLSEQQSEVNVSYVDGYFKYFYPPQKKQNNNDDNNKQTTKGVHGLLPWQTDTVTTITAIEDDIQTLSRTRGNMLPCLSCPYIFLACAQSEELLWHTLVNTAQRITQSGPNNIPFGNDDDYNGLQSC